MRSGLRCGPSTRAQGRTPVGRGGASRTRRPRLVTCILTATRCPLLRSACSWQGSRGPARQHSPGESPPITGGPHTEIDALFHGPAWTPRPEFLADVRSLIRTESWTTEWQYDPARPLLAESAEVLVWRDLPFVRATLHRLVLRTIRRRWSREELWNGNREAPLWTVLTGREHIVRWAFRSRRNYEAAVPGLVQKYPH